MTNEKVRKGRRQNVGGKKLLVSEFLNKEFISPLSASKTSARPQENIFLINASGNASSTALSISKLLLLENMDLEANKNSLKAIIL